MSTSQDARWEHNYAAIKRFIEKNKCQPSKHRAEEHQMLNWIKYNRKLVAKGKLAPERLEKFEQLMAMAADYHKLNQYSYTSGDSVPRKDNDKSLTLF